MKKQLFGTVVLWSGVVAANTCAVEPVHRFDDEARYGNPHCQRRET